MIAGMIQNTCHRCNKAFLTCSPAQKYCSAECRTRQCMGCGKRFVLAGREKTYCSSRCAMSGERNPNFGAKRPGMFQHSQEFRSSLSTDRMGPNNPNWKGGAGGQGKYGSQSYARQWAMEHIGRKCEQCEATQSLEVHHIVARRHFADPSLSNFPQNLMVLCRTHHRRIDGNGWTQGRPLRETPFVDRLPESILQALERDGLVSSLPDGIRQISLARRQKATYRQARHVTDTT